MSAARPLALLVQLPIPPVGREAVRGNVPLAAAYLKLYARRRRLEPAWQIEILPPQVVNRLGDRGILQAILERQPTLVGFTCYLWNVDRSLWLAAELRRQRPELTIVFGGPEITADNAWVLQSGVADYAVMGEGEQTFAELLAAQVAGANVGSIAGLWTTVEGRTPSPRRPLEHLEEISSPYLEGILDAADNETMLLETTRGCAYRCRFCYYSKSYTHQYFLSEERVLANLRHAQQRGAREVFLLDPTLNQRRDFPAFLRLLACGNPERQFTYSAELRAESVRPETARLLAEANFTEVEVGLQSVAPQAQELMDRRINLKAFARGVRAMLDVGIKVRVDLILGLPGDTPDSVRRGIDYLAQQRLVSEVQVFNLSILPGTAFREQAATLGLTYQSRPPYYVLRTPTLDTEDLVDLMAEAQDAFGTEFDPLPPADRTPPSASDQPASGCVVDLDAPPMPLPPMAERTQAFTLWLRAQDFRPHAQRAAALAANLLDDNPHTTLQVVFDAPRPEQVDGSVLAAVEAACYRNTSYLDRYYSLHPNPSLGAKRLVVAGA
jgi:radical SAM superfamily enzyme YgiQ (UPF0313 family)